MCNGRGEFGEGCCYLTVVMDEAAVEAKKTSAAHSGYIFQICHQFPSLDDVAQKTHSLLKLTFLFLHKETILQQSLMNLTDVGLVFILTSLEKIRISCRLTKTMQFQKSRH